MRDSMKSPSENANALPTQSEPEGEVLLQLFSLLEKYAPIWYTEEHRNRAVVALGSLQRRAFSSTSWPTGRAADSTYDGLPRK
jgi:hypothetical protein